MKITAILVLKTTGGAGDSSSSGSADPVILANASDVSHFGFFQRNAAKEFIVFVGRTVARRTAPGQRQSVQHEEYKVHSYNRNGLCALAFMDDHYPVRSAFSLLNKIVKFGASCIVTPTVGKKITPRAGKKNTIFATKKQRRAQRIIYLGLQVIDEYQKAFGESWRKVQEDSTQAWPYLNEALLKFQDPSEADKLLKIQRDLDETKIILEQSIREVVGKFHEELYQIRVFGFIKHKTIDSVLARGEKLDSLVEKSSDLSAASQMFYKQAKKTNQCCTIL